jgi:hypothetical protein
MKKLIFTYLKNKFLWLKLRQEQKKHHKYQDEFNHLLRDILDKIKRCQKWESIILYYQEDEISPKIVYDVYEYLESIGYDILFSQEQECDQMIERLVNYCKLSIKLW